MFIHGASNMNYRINNFKLPCLIAGAKCDGRVKGKEGICIDIETPGNVPNWIGAPKFHLLKPTQDLVPAPLCKEIKENPKPVAADCYCDRGSTAVKLDARGRPRGNCTG